MEHPTGDIEGENKKLEEQIAIMEVLERKAKDYGLGLTGGMLKL